jgi:MHS family proline/betaine transporter-like MFS transporter
MRRVITAAAIGNFVEWFDFAIYGFLATIIAKQFFPHDDPQAALLETFAVFAVAFALRPLGGLFFGRLGDRIGRKLTLAFTIVLMAAATTAVGLLPTHAQAGLWAAVGLTLARCVQGFSAGGEYAGACAYVMEHAPAGRRATLGAFLPVSTFSAFAAAAVVAFVLDAILGKDAMADWGWRVPFIAAAPLGLIGMYLRSRLDESPTFDAQRPAVHQHHAPITEALRSHGGVIACLSTFIAVTALSFYTFTTYFATYLQVVGGMSRSQSLLVTVVALCAAVLLCPLAGRYADAVGRRRTMMTVSSLVLVTVYPSFVLAQQGSLALAIVAVTMQALAAVLSGVVTVVLLSESFPTRIRYTASAMAYNLAYTVFGGTAPLMATWLIGATGNRLAPAIYLMVVAVLALAGGLRLRESSHLTLSEVR